MKSGLFSWMITSAQLAAESAEHSPFIFDYCAWYSFPRQLFISITRLMFCWINLGPHLTCWPCPSFLDYTLVSSWFLWDADAHFKTTFDSLICWIVNSDHQICQPIIRPKLYFNYFIDVELTLILPSSLNRYQSNASFILFLLYSIFYIWKNNKLHVI